MPEDFTTRYDLGYRNGRQQAYEDVLDTVNLYISFGHDLVKLREYLEDVVEARD